MRSPRRSFLPSFLLASSAVALAISPDRAIAADGETDPVAQVVNRSGLTGGFVVHLGCGDGTSTAAMYGGSSFRVHGLDRDAANVQRARQLFTKKGINGHASAAQLRGEKLPYIENLVNLLVAEKPGKVTDAEFLRVLVPEGIAYIRSENGWRTLKKPRPRTIDEWTHYLHDATGNSVAHDKAVGPPRHLQWLGTPRWSRHHDRMASMSALVSAGGRMFYVMDEGSRVSILLPPKWTLIARDAFNGTVLWKRSIPKWHSHLWPLKSGPTQLARRLVATKDRVYVTLGITAPITALDAKTGKTLATYKETEKAEELIYANGTLLATANPGKSELADYKPQFNVGDQRRVSTEFLWDQKPRYLMAIDAESGKLKWKKLTAVAPLSLVSDGNRVCFYNGTKVICLKADDGKEAWSSPADRRKDIQFNFGPRVVIYQDVVLFAGGDRKMAAYDLASGRELWSAPHDKSGYQSPEDLLVSNGLVWSAPTTRTGDTGLFTGRDPRTGEVKKKFAPDVKTYWFHHRCYIAKATDKFLLPSRTGIEFVDVQKKAWEIHHWVRGGCLYGIMPCNGLVYAPPHNCACYPEAKIYGFNALAPYSESRELPDKIDDADRLVRGPAFEAALAAGKSSGWVTYRGDNERSGSTKERVPAELASAWTTQLGGRLTSPVIADGKLYVAQIDAHTVHALDAKTGEKQWQFIAGGRVDSPPTVANGRVVFGCADGWVYCLRSSDGQVAWRFCGAPIDRRLMAFEQLESVWPIHGSVMVLGGNVYAVAGRSNFLDGGLRFLKLDLKTGRKLVETVMDDQDPETKKNLQVRLQTLQMPAGLPDILSYDGDTIFMRSQQFNLYGERLDLGPHSGNPAEQGGTQAGTGRHVFAPMGYLDDTWFHRSYWVYGRSFAGGHAGYYQAGKYTQSGRILVHDGDSVYGFARKPQYLRWTTPLEHQLFAAGKDAPIVDPKLFRRGRRTSMVRFEKTDSLNPKGKAIVVEAWVNAQRPDGTVLARGGPQDGYALILKDGRPRFVVRRDGEIVSATAKGAITGKWTHLIGTLTKDQVRLYVNGKLARESKSGGLLQKDPQQSLEIGADDGSAVGEYRSPYAFRGVIDEVRVYHGTITDAEAAALYQGARLKLKSAETVIAVSFTNGKADDASGKKNHGKIEGANAVAGKVGGGLRFLGNRGGGRAGGSLVKHRWTKDIPLLARAMVLAGKTVFVAGPPDLMDEEKTFEKIKAGDKEVQKLLARQAAALAGKEGALLWAVSTTDGKQLAGYRLPSPPTWDGMAAANARLFVTTIDGRVICLSGK